MFSLRSVPGSTVERLHGLHKFAQDGGITSWSEFQRWREEAIGLLRAILPNGHDRLDHLARYPTHSSYQRNRGYVPSGTPSESVELQSKVEVLANVLGGILVELDARYASLPHLDVTELHPWVSAVADLWHGGHHRQAVDEASRAIEIRLQNKLGRKDLTGTDLVTQAFRSDPPREGEARLRFPEFEPGTLAWKDAHEGAMNFARGCMMRIRNLLEHHDDEPTEQVALEYLAALSLLARWIAEADVQEMP